MGKSHKTDRCEAKSSIKLLVKFINYASQVSTNRFIALDSGPQYTGYEGSNYAAECWAFDHLAQEGCLEHWPGFIICSENQGQRVM